LDLKLKKFFNTNPNKKLKKFYTITICSAMAPQQSELKPATTGSVEFLSNFVIDFCVFGL
jgi:hypothetical protein